MLRTAVAAIITMLYPLAVYFGHARFQPRVMACVLGVVVLVRARAAKGVIAMGLLAGAAALGVIVVLSNDALPLRLYPVLVNAALLATFAWSLYSPPTVVERLARLRDPDLSPAGVAYVTRVTQVWCVFFIANGFIALYTALWASLATWSLYNGLVSYGLMGLLFAGEYIVRLKVMRAGNG